MSMHVKRAVQAHVSLCLDPLRDSPQLNGVMIWLRFKLMIHEFSVSIKTQCSGSFPPLHFNHRPQGGLNNRCFVFSSWHYPMKCLQSPTPFENNVALDIRSLCCVASWWGKSSQVSVTWSDGDIKQTKWSRHSTSDGVYRSSWPWPQLDLFGASSVLADLGKWPWTVFPPYLLI